MLYNSRTILCLSRTILYFSRTILCFSRTDVLYDRPAEQFKSLPDEDKHKLFMKLSKDIQLFKGADRYVDITLCQLAIFLYVLENLDLRPLLHDTVCGELSTPSVLARICYDKLTSLITS